ncbi:dimethylamine:corrinoid methyltransferase [Desulforhopalus singaporensis]|uniref:Dimethylamine:corrinoid methyltransferase n=1 Tax=Desulforhopalus singaporensis TaxID=91360 RepID=A0A1H0IZA0_9BACT|nr:dimethylamine:corrinoid methyltransferase [Desulforhopalus singaporensis]
MSKILTRFGDGYKVELTEDEVKADIEEGCNDAASRAGIEPLARDEQEHIFEMFKNQDTLVGIERGREVVMTYDGMSSKIRRAHIVIDRVQSLQVFERALGADTLELSHIDYSFKPCKPINGFELPDLDLLLNSTVAPVYYGAMPNLGLYSQPDGPCPNPADLLPLGKIDEARQAYEEAIEHAVSDIVFVASAMYEAGVDGINIDTVGAAGDADFLTALKATEILKEKYPAMGIEMGMAGEFVLGMHGNLSWRGVKLAGLYPQDQVRLAQQAGATIFGPAINIVTSGTLPWNVARSVTFCKACSEVSEIPVHANLGMGVCGIPLTLTVPVDALSRATKAHVEICRLDGL